MKRNKNSSGKSRRVYRRRIPATDPYKVNFTKKSNFHLAPDQILRFFANHPELFLDVNRTILDLNKIYQVFYDAEHGDLNYQEFFPGDHDRNDPGFDNDGFIANEIKKMHIRAADYLNPKWFYPFLHPDDEDVFVIPNNDIRDLPNFLMLYLLRVLSRYSSSLSKTTSSKNDNPGFLVSFGLDDDINNSTVYDVVNRNNTPVVIVGKHINTVDLFYIFNQIIQKFISILPTSYEKKKLAHWNGSDESGTRIVLNQLLNGHEIYLKMNFYPAPVIQTSNHWTQQIEDLIMETVGNSVKSVINKTDNKCLIYCLVMGIILKFQENGSGEFGDRNSTMVEASTIFCKGLYRYFNNDPMTKLLQELAKLLVPIVHIPGKELSEMEKLAEDIDKKVGTMMSVSEFRKEFTKMEEILTKGLFGVDVYGIDDNISKHIYPLYISKIRDKNLPLLCVTPKTGGCSHYCVINNMETIMKSCGGKQFFSCSRCGECFYHRRLLKEHKCNFTQDRYEIDGYHYSRKVDNPEDMSQIVGDCPKCRLIFDDEFRCEYHHQHCFMEGQTGYRHVQLITYEDRDHPTLDGQEIDMEKEDKHVESRRMMYADFESSINPETGEHTFMSYGIYDWATNVYECGYSLEDFMNFILNIAFDIEESDIYVYFHNAMGYDANFILRYVLRNPDYQTWGIQVIMKSMNRLQKLVFRINKDKKTKRLHIGDTFLFLTLSLEKIVGSIRKDDININKENFPRFFGIFSDRYSDVDEKDIDHILRKNIFPYKFFTDSSKLNVKKDDFLKIFEPREENLQYFSERVTLEDLRDNYEDTKHVIEVFKCEDACGYHDVYLCCDVMQLADVFERSMNILWESHHIHLTKYLGMPSASWAAFLRHDPSMSIPLYEDTFYAEFFKGMIRGGITSAALRHAVADKDHSIIYLDVNGLYPFVMQKYKFPYGRFEYKKLNWGEEEANTMLPKYFDRFEETETGMCFCVDMEIPESVKKITDMYPFAPEHRRIYDEYFVDDAHTEMTPFLKRWSEANEGETMTEFKGLVCTLYDKTKYNVHWRLLKFYMEHGVIIKKVYFGVCFDEGDYLHGYIKKNIEIRNTRKDELGKTLYKLLGNSIYGKTFESPFNRNTYEIIRDKTKLHGMIEEGNIAAVTAIDDLGWIIRMDGEDIVLDKPTYIGACVCEFAKLHMYTLLYDKLMKIFPTVEGENEFGCQLVYTDTDSFIVKVRHPVGVLINSCEDLFTYIKSKDPDLIGSIGGQVKSETGEDDTIQEVIALRSKVYAYKTIKDHIGKRAKGTTHDAQEMQLNWDTYKQALDSLININTHNTQFVRKTFKIASQDVFKQSLSVNDGKRYICEDGIHTHAFGYLDN